MLDSSTCRVCNQTGSFDDEVCPKCGEKTGNLARSPFSAELAATIRLRAEREWRSESQNQPQLSLGCEQFVEKVLRIAERHTPTMTADNVSQERTVSELLETLKWADLFLATACANGDSLAWERFRQQHQPVIHAAALKTSRSSSDASELSNTLLTDLFLPPRGGSGESKIAQYHGLGSLEGWIKVVIHRMAIDQIRFQQRDVSMEELEGELPANRSHDRADELVEERDIRRAREMVSECLTIALQQLSAQEKLVLNLYYFEGVNLKGIGQFLRAHESTASRLLDRLKLQLEKSVHKQLQQKFKVRKMEISHLIELAQGHMEIDLTRILSE